MPEFFLRKEDKLLKRRQFLLLSKSGERKHNKFFIINYKKSDKTRLGITVTKRVGNAVFRNKIKRLIREYFRLNKKKIKRFDFVLIIKNNINIVNTNDFFFYINDIFKKADLCIE